MESLSKRMQLFDAVIDTWTDLLNHQEKERDKDNSPYRLFMKVHMITHYLETIHFDDDQRYMVFKDNFSLSVNGDKEKLLLKDIDMIFFPVIKSEHIYVICVNLKKPAFEVLDNSAIPQEFYDRYGAVFKPLRSMLLRYLDEIKHPKTNVLSNINISPKRLEMKWRTTENKVDCGVFAVRHMETYVGQSVSAWNPGLGTEGGFQDNVL